MPCGSWSGRVADDEEVLDGSTWGLSEVTGRERDGAVDELTWNELVEELISTREVSMGYAMLADAGAAIVEAMDGLRAPCSRGPRGVGRDEQPVAG